MNAVAIADWKEIRCVSCNRLLLKVRGIAEIETICPRCSSKVMWPDLTRVVLVPVPVKKVLAVPASSTSPTI